ncbi:hypothetical protein HDU76_011458 [Blyttiomyces sp. JEL0837]|nr:hypothetical protein HDU76_011458 [Blyttiomyces sp. JEL0837]
MNNAKDEILTHPGVARDKANNTSLVSELGSAPPAGQKDNTPVSEREDMYPAGIRAIENLGTQKQRDDLHKLEQKH